MVGAGRGGAIPVMGAQGEAIPIMGAFGGPLRRTARGELASTHKDICGNYDLWDFVNVHTTYPLCGWTQSELAMHVTRPVRSRVRAEEARCGSSMGLI